MKVDTYVISTMHLGENTGFSIHLNYTPGVLWGRFQFSGRPKFGQAISDFGVECRGLGNFPVVSEAPLETRASPEIIPLKNDRDEDALWISCCIDLHGLFLDVFWKRFSNPWRSMQIGFYDSGAQESLPAVSYGSRRSTPDQPLVLVWTKLHDTSMDPTPPIPSIFAVQQLPFQFEKYVYPNH